MTAPHPPTTERTPTVERRFTAERTSTAPRADAPPSDDEVRAARRAVAIHRRRRYPDTAVCGLCGYRWQTGKTRSGKPTAGCVRRRRALTVLDTAGLLNADGRIMAPPREPADRGTS